MGGQTQDRKTVAVKNKEVIMKPLLVMLYYVIRSEGDVPNCTSTEGHVIQTIYRLYDKPHMLQ